MILKYNKLQIKIINDKDKVMITNDKVMIKNEKIMITNTSNDKK